MKITIIGTHSVGKTTLINELNKHLDLPLISEVARRFPRDIEDNPVREMKRQIDILNEQLFEEMQNDEFLSDRSTLDNAAYIIWAMKKYHKFLPIDFWLFIFDKIRMAKNHAEKYDHLFYIPIEFPCVDDGFRNTNKNERIFIDKTVRQMWEKTLGRIDTNYRVRGTVKERVEKILWVLDNKGKIFKDKPRPVYWASREK